MPLSRLLLFIVASGALNVARPAHSSLITEYRFDGNSASATTVDPNVSASLFSDTDGSLNFSGAVGKPVPSVFKSYTDLPDGSFDTTDCFQFSVTPDPGIALDFTAFTFDAQKDALTGGGGPASNAHVTIQLASSFDGVSFTDVGSPIQLTANSGAWASYAIDLTALLPLQDVNDEIWFQLCVHDEGRTSDTLGFHVDNVAAHADIRRFLIPEPSSLALLGIGLSGLCGYRWRRSCQIRS